MDLTLFLVAILCKGVVGKEAYASSNPSFKDAVKYHYGTSSPQTLVLP